MAEGVVGVFALLREFERPGLRGGSYFDRMYDAEMFALDVDPPLRAGTTLIVCANDWPSARDGGDGFLVVTDTCTGEAQRLTELEALRPVAERFGAQVASLDLEPARAMLAAWWEEAMTLQCAWFHTEGPDRERLSRGSRRTSGTCRSRGSSGFPPPAATRRRLSSVAPGRRSRSHRMRKAALVRNRYRHVQTHEWARSDQ